MLEDAGLLEIGNTGILEIPKIDRVIDMLKGIHVPPIDFLGQDYGEFLVQHHFTPCIKR